jgi:hypothetical protein
MTKTEKKLATPRRTYATVKARKELGVVGIKDIDTDSSNAQISSTKISKRESSEAIQDNSYPRGSVAALITNMYASAVSNIGARQKPSEVATSDNVLEGTIALMAYAGFKLLKIDPALAKHKPNTMNPDHYWIAFTHKNLERLSGDGYEPVVWITFRKEYTTSINLQYVLYFKEFELFVNTIPQHPVLIFNNTESPESIGLAITKGIASFLNRLGHFALKIDQMKSKKLKADEVDDLKKAISEEYMDSARLNNFRFLWVKDEERNHFAEKIVYQKEPTMFEATINAVATFNATAKRTRKEYAYIAVSETEYKEKNGRIKDCERLTKIVKLPFPYNRRTAGSNVRVAEAIEDFVLATSQQSIDFFALNS